MEEKIEFTKCHRLKIDGKSEAGHTLELQRQWRRNGDKLKKLGYGLGMFGLGPAVQAGNS